MKRVLFLVAAVMMVATGAWAQKIQVVDADGQGIPLVSVMNDDGVIVGITDLDGCLADVKGTQRLTFTHVAYKPQTLNLSLLSDGRVTMEDLDNNLSEIVVKPKPYVYVETYYRAYGFINDSLRYYTAGIMPNAYDEEKDKLEKGSLYDCYGEFYPSTGVSFIWGARVRNLNPGKIHTPTAKSLQPGGKASKKYYLTLTDEGNGRQRISNSEGTVGYIDTRNGQARTTLDAGKAQLYANKVNGENRLQKVREDKGYSYRYTDIFDIDTEGNSDMTDLVMYTNHWEWSGSKGRDKLIIETYTTSRGYKDKKEWKARKKELKNEYTFYMTLDELEEYANSHNIPALTPNMRAVIEGLKKKKK